MLVHNYYTQIKMKELTHNIKPTTGAWICVYVT